LDTFSKSERSEIMRRVKSKNTSPEVKVRSLLHNMGFRFRLHRKDLPGNPDIVLPKRNTVVFVHGCFWHRHKGCKRATEPSSRREYWLPKFERTVKRDAENQKKLAVMGWNVIVVWECELKNMAALASRLENEILHADWGEDFDGGYSLAAESPAEHGFGAKASKLKKN